MFTRRFIPTLMLAVAAMLLSLHVPANAEETRKIDPRRHLARADNDVGFRMLAELCKAGADKNVFISPLSIAIALQMTYNGAGGDTAKEMAAALGISDADLGFLNAAARALSDALTSNDKLTMKIANAIFARKGVAFDEQFLKRNSESYKGRIEALDFSDPAAVEVINKWCADNTNDKIKNVISKLNPLDMMILANAVYFKGNWKHKFKKDETKEEDFTLASGEKIKAQMMHQRMDIKGLMGDDFMAGKLMYEDDRTAMYIFIPDKADGLEKFIARLTLDQWGNWLNSFSAKDSTTIALPRFKVEYQSTLNDALKAMGMKQAFEGGKADFGAMLAGGKKDLYISEVFHKTFVEVNEEGTEAAAVTTVRMTATSAPRRTYNLVADKPFFYAIVDDVTGCVMFMGTMNNPVAK